MENAQACGREAKEVVERFFPELAEGADGSADALGEQKKQLFGNPLYTVRK